MAIILDKYAIKEVADVMFYELDSKGAPSAPVLYLDTLKTSTLSQSSETVDARGGKGNVKLLSWDTNKELTLEITDAVFSAKSLQIMFGGDMSVTKDKQEVLKTLKAKEMTLVTKSGSNFLKFKLNGTEYYISTSLVTAFSYNDAKEAGTDTVTFGGNERTLGKEVSNPVAVANVLSWGDYYGAYDDKPASVLQEIEFVTFDLLDCTASPKTRGDDNGVIRKGMTINITARFDSNTYYITGDTYARNVASGQDEFLQFITGILFVSFGDVSHSAGLHEVLVVAAGHPEHVRIIAAHDGGGQLGVGLGGVYFIEDFGENVVGLVQIHPGVVFHRFTAVEGEIRSGGIADANLDVEGFIKAEVVHILRQGGDKGYCGQGQDGRKQKS